MKIQAILHFEIVAFLGLLAGIVFYKLLTRQISLKGLLLRKSGDGTSVSPERVQLLLATVAVSLNYLGDVAQSPAGSMPDISPQWLYVIGASSGTYLGAKAILTFWTGTGTKPDK
jgi:hypothetical protein